MTHSRTILIAGAFVAMAILFVNGFPKAIASGMGPYQLMNHSNTTANVGVFRIDTSTGDVSYCYLAGGADLNCTRSVH